MSTTFSPAMRKIAIAMYKANALQSEIYETVGCSIDAVRRWARAEGVPPKTRDAVRDPQAILEAIESARAEREIERKNSIPVHSERGYVCKPDCECLLCQLVEPNDAPRRTDAFALRLELG